MRRSRRLHNGRPSASETSERATTRTLEVAREGQVIAAPDRDGSLAEGILVEAAAVVRLFGMRLLTLDASVVISPAELSDPPDVPPVASKPVLEEARRPLRSQPAGADLARAQLVINEAAASLTASRAATEREAAKARSDGRR